MKDKELELMNEALHIFEGQFDNEIEDVQVVDSDSEEYIDIEVVFADGTSENMAFERSRLTDGSTAKEIARSIN